MKRMVIDLETLSVPEALPPGFMVDVVQVGLVILGDDLTVLERREWNVHPCGVSDDGTVRWWMNLMLERGWTPEWLRARNAGEGWKMARVLEEIWGLYGQGEDRCREVWSKGVFDTDILAAHFGMQQRIVPWRHYEVRDLRTLMKTCGVSGRLYSQVAHEGLADALAEAKELKACLEMISHGGTEARGG
jgi:hypothetical protein